MIAVHLPADSVNPYSRLVCEGLATTGVDCDIWADPPRRGNPRQLLPRLRRADLVHWHWLESFYQARTTFRFLLRTALFASLMLELRLRRIPQVVTVHNLLPHERRFEALHRVASRVVGASANRLLVHSTQAVGPVAELYGGREKIRIVPHVDYEDPLVTAAPRELRARWNLTGRQRWAIVFGGMRRYKRIHLALRAAPALARRDFGLVVAGPCPDPSYRGELRAAAEGSSTRLLLRHLDSKELSELLLASDVALMPHRGTLTSGTAQFALSHGLAIAATEAAAFRELGERKIAILRDFRDPESIAEAVDAAFAAKTPEWSARVRAYRAERAPAVVGYLLSGVYRELTTARLDVHSEGAAGS